jgi:hypothetical protein
MSAKGAHRSHRRRWAHRSLNELRLASPCQARGASPSPPAGTNPPFRPAIPTSSRRFRGARNFDPSRTPSAVSCEPYALDREAARRGAPHRDRYVRTRNTGATVIIRLTSAPEAVDRGCVHPRGTKDLIEVDRADDPERRNASSPNLVSYARGHPNGATRSWHSETFDFY